MTGSIEEEELREWAAKKLAEILSLREREREAEESPPQELKDIYRILDDQVAPILDASGVPITREELEKMFTEWFVRTQSGGGLQPLEVAESGVARRPPSSTAALPSSTKSGVPLRRIIRLLGIVTMLVPLVLIPAYFFLSTQIPPPTTPVPPLASGILTLAPDTPLIAPGQTQNYSLLTLTMPPTQSSNTMLTAVSPEGLSFQISHTTLSPEETTNIPVTIRASAALSPGDYRVTVKEREGSAERDQTFTVKVVPTLVVMEAVAFVPGSLRVTAGTTVYWMNLDSTIGCCDPGYHNVAFQGGGMNLTSPIMRRLNTWSYTFGTPGSFYYYCTIHPWMVGVVVVTTGNTTSSASSSTGPVTGGVKVTIPGGAVNPNGAPGYAPDKVVVVVGMNNTVTWTNNDTAPHTVTSITVPPGASAFDSGEMMASATYSFTFTVPGTYEYRCGYHPWMVGTVVVESGP